MAEQLANNASTTLNGAINNSVTSVVVTDGSKFPSTGNFRILVGTELMLVTARSSNTLTVTRGIESTTAASHADLDIVDHVYTKGSLDQILADYSQIGGYASRPSSPRKGTIYTATDIDARWFYNGSSWDMIWPTIVPNARQIDFSSWTALNITTAVFTNKNGIIDISGIPVNTNNVTGYVKSLPTAPYTLNLIISPNRYTSQAASIYFGRRESSTGKMKLVYTQATSSGVTGLENWNSATSFNAAAATAYLMNAQRYCFVKLEDDNTNWKYYISSDGKNYTQLWSETRNSFMTTAADQVFIGAFQSSTYAQVGNVSPNRALYAYWEA